MSWNLKAATMATVTRDMCNRCKYQARDHNLAWLKTCSIHHLPIGIIYGGDTQIDCDNYTPLT